MFGGLLKGDFGGALKKTHLNEFVSRLDMEPSELFSNVGFLLVLIVGCAQATSQKTLSQER